jgi:cyclic beta-1,2-glucan synthetase
VAHYVQLTGDEGILGEVVPYLDGAPLAPGEMEAYMQPSASAESSTVLDHCIRAVEKSLTPGRTACRSSGAETGTTA